jgi:hypothetical protein
MNTGTTTTISLSAVGLDGFGSNPISVQAGGLPTGVTVSPANISVTPGTPVTLTLSAAAGMTPTTATVNLTGTYSTLSHAVPLDLTVTPGMSATLSTRTQYLRTDAVTEYYLWTNSHWVVYHTPTAHFFVTDPFDNQVLVLDPATETKIATIAVPGAYGIDETPDQSSLYVGTLIGDVYELDPVAMQVKHRYLASQIGPYGYQALIALVLSNGSLALMGEPGGIPGVDGSNSAAIWNPADNSITIYGSALAAGTPTSSLCGNGVGLHLFDFSLTSDRSSFLTNAGGGLCELNALTGQSLTTTPIGTGALLTSPDGKYIVVPIYPNAVELIDQKTLNHVTTFNVSSDQLSDASLIFSTDGKTLYVTSSGSVNAYDVASQQLIGWMPNIVVEYTSGGFAGKSATNPIFQAFDSTGLMVGPLEEGFGFLDTTQLRTGPLGTIFSNSFLTPDTGPVSGGTVIQFPLPSDVNSQSSFYFGNNLATAVSSNGTTLSVTTPPGNPGPVNVFTFTSDGGMELTADGFSYGPSILQVTPERSTAEGGGAGVIYGYGFAPASAAQIPSDLSVSVGGKPAPITAVVPNAYGVSPIPYLLQAIYYTIPAGTAGTAVDVSVTTSAGTGTISGGMTYLPALRQFPLAGASLAQGIYDPIRDVYYFTDANKIQVFSLSQGTWLTPIAIPAPTGAVQRLWGISLSPDGSKMAVADAQAGVVYLLDPSNPSSVKTFSAMPTTETGTGVNVYGVAVSNAGIVYYAAYLPGGTANSNFFALDTGTGTITDYHLGAEGVFGTDSYLRLAVSSDGTRVFINVGGWIYSIDTASGTLFSALTNSLSPGDDELAFCSNQMQVEANAYLYDTNLNAEAQLAYNDREALNISYLYGAKFSPDGSLLFQPSTNGVDILDGRLGKLRNRIAFQSSLSQNYDALVSDGKDSILLAITGASGSGIAVLDLSSIEEPAPLPYPAKASDMSSEMKMHNSAESSPEATGTRADTKPPAARPRVIPHVTKLGVLRPK